MNIFNCFRYRHKWVVWILTGLLFIFVTSPLGNAWARRKLLRGHGAPNVKYGKFINVLPAGHRVVTVGKVRYHYRHGVFYKHRGKKWIVVRPPIGAVVAVLTAAAVLVTVSGTPYYLCEGTYYKKVPAGYKVVEVPSSSVTTPVAGQKVRVTVHLLNLRLRPGKKHNVIQQIPERSILTVKGNAPGWLYVALDNGTMGWVMEACTTTLRAPAQG